MRVRLNNAWKNREEVIRRCEKQRACYGEFMKLKAAKTEKAFVNVLWRNMWWVIAKNILDHDLAWASWTSGTYVNVTLKKPYSGISYWKMNRKGELIEPW